MPRARNERISKPAQGPPERETGIPVWEQIRISNIDIRNKLELPNDGGNNPRRNCRRPLRRKTCHPEDFEKAGRYFWCGMTEATSRRSQRMPQFRRSGGSASPRAMLKLALEAHSLATRSEIAFHLEKRSLIFNKLGDTSLAAPNAFGARGLPGANCSTQTKVGCRSDVDA